MNSFLDLLTQYALFFGLPLIFLAIVLWVYRPGAKKRYEDDGKLPFYGDKPADKAPDRRSN